MNKLDVFARGYGDRLFHKGFDGNAWQPGRVEWTDLGGEVVFDLTAVSFANGRIDIFAQNADQRLMHKILNNREAYPDAPDWEDLGGEHWSPAAVSSWLSGRLDIVTAGPGKGWESDFRLQHKYWDGTQWIPGYDNWEDLSGQTVETPGIVAWADARLDVFAQGSDPSHTFYKSWQDGQGWYPGLLEWADIGGPPRGGARPVAVSWGQVDL